MATTGPGAAGAGATEREPRQHERTSSSSQIVIVDLDEPQPAHLVRRLRKGKGKLLARVDRIVGDLVDAGTIKATAQPVVIVVRELPPMPWSFEDDDED